MAQRPDFAIELDKIVASRPGGERIPKFIINWLKKFVHQDFLNSFFVQGYEGAEFCRETLKYLDVKMEVEGLENLDLLPEGAHCTIASNHPLGGVDGVAVLGVVAEHFNGKIRLLVNDFLMAIKGLAPICVPVNKMGAQSRNLGMQVSEAYDSDNEIMIFPAGVCSRKIDGKVQDLEWKITFLKQSIRTGRYIIPVHFIAENSPRFYRVANWSKKLGIKFNLAMLFLPDELYKAQHKTFRMVIGKPIPPEFFDSSRSIYKWSQWLREETYKL